MRIAMEVNGINLASLLYKSHSRQEMWHNFLNAQHTRAMAEIGVWKGDFAANILASISHLEIYFMIDPWANLPDWNKPYNVKPEIFESIYQEMLDKTDFATEKRKILRGRTKEVIHKIPDESLDFIYIDGDHTLRGITIDLITLWPKIKQGGFIGGDDFTATPWQHDVAYEPTMVCPLSIYFSEAMNVPIMAPGFCQFLIQKDDRLGFSFLDLRGDYQDLSLNKFPSSSFS
jgi:hypothetical protein